MWRVGAAAFPVGTAAASIIAKNGFYKTSFYWDCTNASFTRIPNGGNSTILDLKAGDQISMRFANSLGTAITLQDQSNSGSDTTVYTYLEIYRIGN